MKITTTTKFAIIAILVLLAADWFYLRQVHRQPAVSSEGYTIYSQKDLVLYDGSDVSKPVLLAMDGYVYDVTAGRSDFYGLGQAYHYLAGHDASIPLQLFGKEIIKSKYRIVGVYKP